MLSEILFLPFEAFLNRGLQQSEAARAQAGELEGRVLALTVEGTPFDLRLRVGGGRITVGLPDGTAPDASIGGTPLGLARLLGQEPRSALRDGSVHLAGDVELAGQFQELLRLASPDIGQELTRLVGEPMAREIEGARRAFAEWSGATGDRLARNVAEYLQADSRMVPGSAEFADFARRVDGLVNDVERAAARIQRLEETL
jgi:ubiquinone biosynthesis protein UbiJ